MSKLPMNERPPFGDIERRLFDRVSYQYRQLFVSDIQNDCSCSIEVYDREPAWDTWILSELDKVEKITFGERLALPMLSDISDKSVLSLLKTACDNIKGEHDPDVLPGALLTNTKSTSDKITHLMEKTIGRGIVANRSGIIYGLAFVDFLPIDEFVLVPEPEFFGALSVNIGGFGAFCISNNLIRIKQ